MVHYLPEGFLMPWPKGKKFSPEHIAKRSASLDAIEREAGKAGRTLDAETLKAVREGLYGG